MKRFMLIISLLMVIALVFGCGGGTGVGGSGPIEIAEAFFQAIADVNTDKFLDLLDNDSSEAIKEDIAENDEELPGLLIFINNSYEETLGEEWTKKLSYELKEEKSDSAIVDVTRDDEDRTSFEIYLVKEDGKWKFDWEKNWQTD